MVDGDHLVLTVHAIDNVEVEVKQDTEIVTILPLLMVDVNVVDVIAIQEVVTLTPVS
jgi:hypothetical protein